MMTAYVFAADVRRGRPWRMGENGEGSGRPNVGREAKAGSSPSDLRIGFVSLVDAAPLIAARELGYFADEGLRVTLERQIGWGNVRDKLIYGHLHASHALVGMPPLSRLGRDRFPEPLVAIMALGAGGNAITLGRRLTDSGIDSAAELVRHAKSRRRNDPPLLAHVFGCSMHHYLLRDWLADAGMDVAREVRFCVLPPSQMSRQLQSGGLDGFCAGEPWNTLAEQEGLGKIVAVTVDVLPDHPEKVLATSERWLGNNPAVAAALIRAILRGCAFCANAANYSAQAEMLAKSAYLALPAELLLRSLKIDSWFGGPSRRAAAPFRKCGPEMTFPAATHAAWILGQMQRWDHLPADTDVLAVARESVSSAAWRKAAATMKLAGPADDVPPMRLRTGWFDPKSLVVT
jgi:ABC-type nitrate/sulfonate/bicarbonate transport system substrate-binding protein